MVDTLTVHFGIRKVHWNTFSSELTGNQLEFVVRDLLEVFAKDPSTFLLRSLFMFLSRKLCIFLKVTISIFEVFLVPAEVY